MREIRMLRSMWRGLETESRLGLHGHERGNPGYRQDHNLTDHRASPDPTRHLGRILSDYRQYYNRSRTHLALQKDAPDPRATHERKLGEVIAFPEVGGLHHRYERRAA